MRITLFFLLISLYAGFSLKGQTQTQTLPALHDTANFQGPAGIQYLLERPSGHKGLRMETIQTLGIHDDEPHQS
jgi:hypothetical protein